jgi:hypothetical protein
MLKPTFFAFLLVFRLTNFVVSLGVSVFVFVFFQEVDIFV